MQQVAVFLALRDERGGNAAEGEHTNDRGEVIVGGVRPADEDDDGSAIGLFQDQITGHLEDGSVFIHRGRVLHIGCVVETMHVHFFLDALRVDRFEVLDNVFSNRFVGGERRGDDVNRGERIFSLGERGIVKKFLQERATATVFQIGSIMILQCDLVNEALDLRNFVEGGVDRSECFLLLGRKSVLQII